VRYKRKKAIKGEEERGSRVKRRKKKGKGGTAKGDNDEKYYDKKNEWIKSQSAQKPTDDWHCLKCTH